jgi:DNA-binding MarR family transcriptional regulator
MSELNVVDLLRALQVMEKKISVALMYSGLRIPQFRLLEYLDNNDSATVTEISCAMGVTRATISVMTNELIRSSVLITEDNPTDRRSFHLRLTELGRNKLNVARSDMAVMRKKISRNYSEETLKQLNAFARQVLGQ